MGNKNAAGPRKHGILPANVGYNAKTAVHRALGMKQIQPQDTARFNSIVNSAANKGKSRRTVSDADFRFLQKAGARGTKPQFKPFYPK